MSSQAQFRPATASAESQTYADAVHEVRLFWGRATGRDAAPGDCRSPVSGPTARAPTHPPGTLEPDPRKSPWRGRRSAENAQAVREAGHRPGRRCHRRPRTQDTARISGGRSPAISEADTDGNDLTIVDPQWTPLLRSPPPPGCVSGHATFSGAAAESGGGLWQPGEFRGGLVVPAGDHAFLAQLPTSR